MISVFAVYTLKYFAISLSQNTKPDLYMQAQYMRLGYLTKVLYSRSNDRVDNNSKSAGYIGMTFCFSCYFEYLQQLYTTIYIDFVKVFDIFLFTNYNAFIQRLKSLAFSYLKS